jgi:WD40 repeat protein
MVLVYDVFSGRLVGPDLGGDCYHVPGVAFAPDGRTLAAITTHDDPNGSMRLWDWPSGEPRAAWRALGNALAFSPDGRLLVTAHGGGLELRDAEDGRWLAAYRWHGDRIQAVAFSPDGQWIATASDDHFVKLWPVAGLLGG